MSSDTRGLFNRISVPYGWFFGHQRRMYQRALDVLSQHVTLQDYRTALDIGCGTGALALELAEQGLSVTGVDTAAGMLAVARKNTEGSGIRYLQADVLSGLPFDDDAFEMSFASFVAHGLEPDERSLLYRELARVTSDLVLLYDYNKKRSLVTDVVEWAEGGDYFRFIRSVPREMEECVHAMRRCFADVSIVPAAERANWYLCRPAKKPRAFGAQDSERS